MKTISPTLSNNNESFEIKKVKIQNKDPGVKTFNNLNPRKFYNYSLSGNILEISSLSFFEMRIVFQEPLGNLDCVKGCAFLDLVAYSPEAKTTWICQILADSSHIDWIFT